MTASLHVLYRFNDLRLPWLPIYMGWSFGRWTLTVWTRNGKFTWSTGHGYQEDDWWYPLSRWALAKENIFNLFDILKKRWQYYTHMRLHYRCLKFWMVKIWSVIDFIKISWYQSFPPYSIDMLMNIKSSSAHIISLYCNNAQWNLRFVFV